MILNRKRTNLRNCSNTLDYSSVNGLKKIELFLSTIDQENIHFLKFPLRELLDKNLYYPASGFDGRPIAYSKQLGTISYTYVDCYTDEDELDQEINKNGFKGYSLIATRNVSKEELMPNGCSPLYPHADDGDPSTIKIKPFFCRWMVFEREKEFGKEHGPNRFSLLYICADGVSTYQGLYVSNQVKAAAVAVIQPGHGFGGNWTDFEDEKKIFARTVLSNPVGKPQFLLYGGIGYKHWYRKPCWREYSNQVCVLGDTSIRVWGENDIESVN